MDYTITMGNLISTAIAVGSIMIAAWRISLQLSRMSWKLDLMWRWYAKEHGMVDEEQDK